VTIGGEFEIMECGEEELVRKCRGEKVIWRSRRIDYT
jgi:hypothetical protein